MNALLDSIEALKTISVVVPEQRSKTKKPRKSNLQHRIIQKNPNSNFVTCSSLDQSLSPSLPFVPLRPLSVSPPRYIFNINLFVLFLSQFFFYYSSVEIFESIPDEIELNVKSEEQQQQPLILTNTPLPIIIPNSHCISQIPPTIPEQNIWPSILSIHSSEKRSKTTNHRRLKPSRPSSTNQNSTRVNDSGYTIFKSIFSFRYRNLQMKFY